MRNLLDNLKNWWKSLSRLEEQPVPEEDPITSRSLATPIAVFSLLLILSLFWALYDEVWGLRPWINYQNEFVEQYREILQDRKPDRREEEQQIYASEGYQHLQGLLEEADSEIKSELGEIEKEEDLVLAKLAALTTLFTTERSRIQAKIYELETASEGSQESLGSELKEMQETVFTLEIPQDLDGTNTTENLNFAQLEEEFNRLKQQQGTLQGRKVGLLRSPQQLRQELNQFVQARLTSLTENQIDGILTGLDNFDVEIKQIHNADFNLVDRCESCHVGIQAPLPLSSEDFQGKSVFKSHPSRELLQIHDPETFGCSPCHNGNGVATVNVTKAHGEYRHWLWTKWAPENKEAGCLHCHEADRHLNFADTLNAGRQLFYNKGCWGCHARDGYDPAPRLLRDAQKSITDLTQERQETLLKIGRTERLGDSAETNEEANRLYAEATRITMGVEGIDSQTDQFHHRVEQLMMEEKRVGPNLREVRLKLKPEWIPMWIQNPHAFRPNSKMPSFRFEDEQQVQALSAFIWQSAISDFQLPQQASGDPEQGKTLFESRGCMACHAVGEEDQAVGGSFAANLSRMGEKANYDYLVRWIQNPRQRTYPFCPIHGRDITPQDYADQGLPFVFGLENAQCPLGDHLLQVQQPTVMPNLRLTPQEARNIASYLMTLKHDDAQYEAVPYLEDTELFEKGRQLARHFGCKGCHDIKGLESEGKIGTDLTKEGSKPIERLDFALLTEHAKAEGWYNAKGFFERKLRDPAIFDEGKQKAPLEKLRMPNVSLTEEEITQLTTFLVGSVDSKYPETFFYQPSDERQYIQEGWWVVMKYNCVACHQFQPGQPTVMEGLPQYQSPDGREQLPPSLVGQGSRTNPNWLAGFLKNPALNQTNLNRNGVRSYLQTRMPSFNLSDGEIQKLVRFFSALSGEDLPFSAPRLDPLSSRELTMARDLFTHQAAPCMQCHATGNITTDRDSTAPNFLFVPERLKSDWTRRWIVHPEIIRPGTAMPSGLFRQEGGRWVFALADVPSLRNYPGDHAELLVRYMFQYTAQEQRRLGSR